MTLADRFEGRHNSLNLLRLVLAASVIVWHSFAVTGGTVPFGAGEGRLGDIGVDGFFGLSGFLIVRSWERFPHLGRFAWHRALRILPGFYACLLTTMVIFAPVAVLHKHGDLGGFMDGHPLRFLTSNAALHMNQYDVAGTPTGVAYPGSWGSALWTLYWESLCYVGVAALGVTGLLLRRPALLIVMFAACTAIEAHPSFGYGFNWHSGPLYLDGVNGPRLALMFTIGALFYLYRERVPMTRTVTGLAAILLAIGLATPHYRAVAAVPYVYLLLWLSIALPPRLQRVGAVNDISYGVYIYGFQTQQLLATFGAATVGIIPFIGLSLALTVPAALLSWVCIERPAMRLKNRWGRSVGGPTDVDAPLAVSPAAA